MLFQRAVHGLRQFPFGRKVKKHQDRLRHQATHKGQAAQGTVSNRFSSSMRAPHPQRLRAPTACRCCARPAQPAATRRRWRCCAEAVPQRSGAVLQAYACFAHVPWGVACGTHLPYVYSAARLPPTLPHTEYGLFDGAHRRFYRRRPGLLGCFFRASSAAAASRLRRFPFDGAWGLRYAIEGKARRLFFATGDMLIIKGFGLHLLAVPFRTACPLGFAQPHCPAGRPRR